MTSYLSGGYVAPMTKPGENNGVSIADIVGRNIVRWRKQRMDRSSETITIGWGEREGKVVQAWSQEGMREQLRIYGIKWNHTKISKLENGEKEPTATDLFQLAHFFGVPVWMLYVPPVEWVDRTVADEGVEPIPVYGYVLKYFVNLGADPLYAPRLLGNAMAHEYMKSQAGRGEPYDRQIVDTLFQPPG